MNTTPLRYPGGKSIISPLIDSIISVNKLRNVVYAEPYAGGAGAAINLLSRGIVDRIMINDACIGIYSFWKFLLEKSKQFMTLFEETPVTLEEWKKQRFIYKNRSEASLELGFATFFLSRTNRSGILYAGPIGGQEPDAQRKAKYQIDCRYNKKTLREQLRNIIRLRDKITVSNMDALDFLMELSGDEYFLYIDPPYYEKGKQLYMNYYTDRDHKELSLFLKNSNLKWILSYDNVQPIRELYREHDLYKFNITYSIQNPKKGIELFTHSQLLTMPKPLEIKTSKRVIPLYLTEQAQSCHKISNAYKLLYSKLSSKLTETGKS